MSSSLTEETMSPVYKLVQHAPPARGRRWNFWLQWRHPLRICHKSVWCLAISVRMRNGLGLCIIGLCKLCWVLSSVTKHLELLLPTFVHFPISLQAIRHHAVDSIRSDGVSADMQNTFVSPFIFQEYNTNTLFSIPRLSVHIGDKNKSLL